jgi:hypothetical protein
LHRAQDHSQFGTVTGRNEAKPFGCHGDGA